MCFHVQVERRNRVPTVVDPSEKASYCHRTLSLFRASDGGQYPNLSVTPINAVLFKPSRLLNPFPG